MDTKKALSALQDALKECEIMSGTRHIVVLDRGWIFVGELSPLENDIYTLKNCWNIRKWSQNGFGGLTKGMKYSGATLDKSNPIQFHKSAMILCSPVTEDWENE